MTRRICVVLMAVLMAALTSAAPAAAAGPSVMQPLGDLHCC